MKKAHKKRSPRATANSPRFCWIWEKLLYKSGKFIRKYKLSITQDTQKQAVKFGNTALGLFIDQIETKCAEAEHRIAQMDNCISLSHKAFHILIVILIVLFSFLVCMIVANVEFLHLWLIGRMVATCGLIVFLGITMVSAVMRF